MRRVTKFILGAIALLCCIVCSSCRGEYRAPKFMQPDTTLVKSLVQDAVNPNFTSVAEVLDFQDDLCGEVQVNDFFIETPPDIVANVAKVCIKKFGSAKKRDIVNEYLRNQTVYDNLVPDDAKQETAMEEQQKPVEKPNGHTTIRVESDTIDGVPYKVTVREERTYE